MKAHRFLCKHVKFLVVTITDGKGDNPNLRLINSPDSKVY